MSRKVKSIKLDIATNEDAIEVIGMDDKKIPNEQKQKNIMSYIKREWNFLTKENKAILIDELTE